MLEKLARIPFHFIVMLTPDVSFEGEMKKQGFAFSQDYYEMPAQHTVDLPTKDTVPLFYHLLGIADKTDSLIVTHKQMYDYIKALLGEVPKLPDNVKTPLNSNNVKNLIFLGVNFDKWYFQLILNMLKVDTNKCKNYAFVQTGDSTLQTIWEKHFNIIFVKEEIDEFVDKLHELFKDKDKLRKSAAAGGKQIKKVYNVPNIKNFFIDAFKSDQFESFCQDYFEKVYNEFTKGESYSTRIGSLITYVQQEVEFDKLLKLMEEANAKQYTLNGPYYDEQ